MLYFAHIRKERYKHNNVRQAKTAGQQGALQQLLLVRSKANLAQALVQGGPRRQFTCLQLELLVLKGIMGSLAAQEEGCRCRPPELVAYRTHRDCAPAVYCARDLNNVRLC